MYNRFIIKHTDKQYRKITEQQKRNDNWIRRYKTEIRPALISKHERRIQGFAKKMECQPVVLPENVGQTGHEDLEKSQGQRSRTRLGNLDSGRSGRKADSSTRFKTEESKIDLAGLKQLTKKYIEPPRTFRDREKQKQINPPMKYGNKNSKMIIKALTVLKRAKKQQPLQKPILQTRKRNLSRGSHDSNYDSNQNYSDFDIMSINNDLILQRAENIKTEAQIKQQEQLKALSHNRLYFKSLLNFQQKVKDQTFKDTIKGILVKCHVVKPVHQRKKKEQLEKDQFANLVKLFVNPEASNP